MLVVRTRGLVRAIDDRLVAREDEGVVDERSDERAGERGEDGAPEPVLAGGEDEGNGGGIQLVHGRR